jgi:hypothetical protein
VASVPPRAPADAASGQASRAFSAAALQRFDAEKARSGQPAAPVDPAAARKDQAYASAASGWRSNPDSYLRDRAQAMPRWQASNPGITVIVHEIQPHYGVYDSLFLTAMFMNASSNASYANWLYSHQGDPWYQQAHDDMVRQAHQNADLRAQLAQADDRVALLRAQNAQAMPSAALPQGVDQSVAFAPEVVQADSLAYATPGSSHAWIYITIIVVLLAVVAVLLSSRRRA